jgi:5-methyltetrahydrofolate--homocysteine methyltransferase
VDFTPQIGFQVKLPTMSTQSFLSRLRHNDLLVADGATGTTLIARGLPVGLTAENWVMDRPDQIIQLHKDFINSGANIILTSTFSATPIRLKGTSLVGKSDAINHTAVKLAKSAVGDSPVFIAGSLGPIGQLLKPFGPLEPEDVTTAYAQQARALTAAGVDLLVIETQFDLGEIKAAVKGARSASKLPLVVSISYDRGKRTMMGVSPSQAARELQELPIDMMGINCGHSLEENLQNLVELRNATTKPIWFKPNAGLPRIDSSGNTIYEITPDGMGAQVPAWLAAGAQVVGGCCGTSPEHLAEISRQVASQRLGQVNQ